MCSLVLPLWLPSADYAHSDPTGTCLWEWGPCSRSSHTTAHLFKCFSKSNPLISLAETSGETPPKLRRVVSQRAPGDPYHEGDVAPRAQPWIFLVTHQYFVERAAMRPSPLRIHPWVCQYVTSWPQLTESKLEKRSPPVLDNVLGYLPVRVLCGFYFSSSGGI
jgi:hypothetical protein